jgi:4-hydroxy-4-methyl-2-oxoglutarate aldolase
MSQTVSADMMTRFRALSSALVSDALDGCGYRDQVLKPGLMPLDPSAGPVVGVAVPVLAEPTTRRPLEPYAKLFRVLETIGPGQVVVATTQGSQDAFWGELLSLRAQYRGAVGAVIDGMVRDRAKVRALGFPVIAAGSRPTDSNGRIEVVDYGHPVLIRGVRVEPGDIVVGDEDGIVVVPLRIAQQVLADAEAKQAAEASVRDALRAGESVVEVFRRFKVM